MNKGLKKKLALILAFVMVMSTGIANVFTAYADDDMVPVTIIKYWEDMGWNGGQGPSSHPHGFSFCWHDGGSTSSVTLDGSNNFRAHTSFSQSFINSLNAATDQYGIVSNMSSYDGENVRGTFFDELYISYYNPGNTNVYNTTVFIWDNTTNTLRVYNSNADQFVIVHKEWIGKYDSSYSITVTATDGDGEDAHAFTGAINSGGIYEGGSLTMTMNEQNGWTQPFMGLSVGPNWTINESQSNGWTSIKEPAQLIQYDGDKSYYLYNIKNYTDTDIPVEKEWKNVPDGVTPPDVNVSITQEVEGIDQPVGTITLSNYDPGSHMSYGSFIGRLNGNYNFTENPVPAGYRFNGVRPEYDENGNLVKYVLENEYIGNADRRVVKIWQDLPDGVTPPETITVDLVGDDGSILETVTLLYNPSTGQSEGWVSGNGQVVENPVPSGYSLVGITLKTDDEGNEYWEIVNKYDGGGTGGKDRRVVKIWEGLPDGVTPPATLEVTKLDADGNPIGTIILNLVPGTNTSEGYVGSEVYGLREDNIPAGYTFMGITLKTDDEGNEYWEIINKYDGGGTGGKDRRVVKIWEGLPDGVTPPETLEVTKLDADGNPIGTIILNLVPGTNTSEGYVGPDVYGIREDNVPNGYRFVSITWVDDDEGGHWEIINEYIGGKDTRVVKIWEGLPDGVTPPETLEVTTLDANGNPIGTITLNLISGINISEGYADPGVAGIREDNVPNGYRFVSITWVDDDEGGHWEIINEYIGGKDTRVVKIWEGLPDGVTPPETLEVTTLDADGNPIGTVILYLVPGTNTSEGYVGPDVYGIREDNVPEGFTLVSITWVKDDDGGHWEIVNRYNKKPTPVIKNWLGRFPGEVPCTLTSVDVYDATGKLVETVELTYDPETGTSIGYLTVTATEPLKFVENPVPDGWYYGGSSLKYDELGSAYYELINYRYYVADITISSVEVIRGQYLVWTIVTSESISWLRLDGIYTPEGGSRKKTSVIYKSDTTSSNIERTVEDGVATWKIKMKFNYSEDVQSVIQSWTLSYKVADETAYRKANYDSPITVTVYKDESTMIDVTEGYPSYSVVSVSGPETAAVGQYGTITVVTTSDCDKIRIGYDNGGKMKYATYQTTTKNNVSYVDDAETGLRTWTINYKFATDATQYTVQGRGPKWDAEKAQNFTVNFG